MNPSQFDPAQYKVEQRHEWDQAAEGWKRWWQTIERGMQPVSDRLVELAEIGPGQRVLDVATGIGEPAVTAARRVGLTGHVVATDISPQMLTIAAGRVAAEGLSNIEFVQADAETLDLPDSSFDAVLCRFGLMFLPDVESALRRIFELLVPGGRFAAAVWGPPEKVPMSSVPLGVIRRELQIPPPPPSAPGIFSLSDPTHLEELLRRAGFSQVDNEPMTVALEMSSADEFVRYRLDVAAPMRALLASETPERQNEIRQAITQAMQSYITADGTLRVENEAILAVGRR
jgi:enediyne biosynthesis protein CalE5